MLSVRAVKEVKVEFGESQVPSCESFSAIRKIEDPSGGIVISA